MKHEAKKESPTQFLVSSVIFFALAIPLFGLFTLLTSLLFGTSPGWLPVVGGFLGPILAAFIADKVVMKDEDT